MRKHNQECLNTEKINHFLDSWDCMCNLCGDNIKNAIARQAGLYFIGPEAIDSLHAQSMKCSIYHALECVTDKPKCKPLFAMVPGMATESTKDFMQFEKAMCLNH